ncbi:odorant receptor 67c-like [Euwallacea similis]|uniref:odorant receptor 67c-like n=1 Tax=Euwallacea similis TaxID=1736056 RepID=UPI00344BFCDA
MEYKKRHDLHTLNRKLASKLGLLQAGRNPYEHALKPILETESHLLYWDRTVSTNRIIYPQCENLRIALKWCSMVGILPSEFMFPENKKMRSAYDVYSNITLVYWAVFIVTAYIELYLILNENPIKKDLMSLNLCITLIYTVIFCRRLITRISPSFKKMIKTIIEDQMKGDLIDDELIQKLDRENIENSNWKCKIYIYFMFIVCLTYFTKPIMVGPVEETYGNATKIVKELPLSTWFPFNVQEYYKCIGGIVGANSVMVIDLLLISLIFYLCRQLRKLDHLLRNFQDFKRKYQALNAIEDEEMAAFLFFKHLIVRHENIIQYVNIYNKNMGYPMMLDFIQSSIQIATAVTQVSGNEITLLLIASVTMFSISMLLRLCLYYYYADELLILSQKLTHSIWESNWPDETPKIKFMILIFIMRVQKSLAFTIGPFGVMSIQSFISILKGTYSYVMLIMT